MRVPQSRRAGMSLTELLVVIAILGLLAITVVPTFGTSAELRRTQSAQRAVSSFLARAQARSIGRSTWSGFRLLPLNASSFAVDQIVAVDAPEPYRGDTSAAAVSVSAGVSGTATPVVSTDFARLASLTITNNDVIRFDGRGPSYQITSGTNLPILFGLRGASAIEDVGQSPLNTPWPSPGSHTIEIFRQPIPASAPFTVPENRVIDLRWSGFGPAAPGLALSGSFSAGALVTVLFDGSGRMRQFSILASGSTTVITASMPIFFLVGREDRAGQDPQAPLVLNDDSAGSNWQYADSWWLAIDPASGIVKAAECNPAAATFADSQLFIRQALTNNF